MPSITFSLSWPFKFSSDNHLELFSHPAPLFRFRSIPAHSGMIENSLFPGSIFVLEIIIRSKPLFIFSTPQEGKHLLQCETWWSHVNKWDGNFTPEERHMNVRKSRDNNQQLELHIVTSDHGTRRKNANKNRSDLRRWRLPSRRRGRSGPDRTTRQIRMRWPSVAPK